MNTNAIKIARPFANAFNTALNGQTVSYSTRAKKVAIGNHAVTITAEQATEIENTSNAYGDKFRLVVSLFNDGMSA